MKTSEGGDDDSCRSVLEPSVSNRESKHGNGKLHASLLAKEEANKVEPPHGKSGM